MKLFNYALAFSFAVASVTCNVNISTPHSGAKLVRGKQFTVQIIEPPSVAPADGIQEIDYYIGIVTCTNSGCPSPSSGNLGDILFLGLYQPQGIIGNPPFPPTYQNFTLSVPSDIPAGKAAIQVQKVVFIASPVSYLLSEDWDECDTHPYRVSVQGQADASLQYGSVQVQVST
ncbi:hypothetical protein CVT26_014460 [Gymnopilus dilepis]|uniref:Phosphatidylglycerol/phosphatidylinositol transfer protein n=1 Tax=Gymnopilus dilepis TaxID=231916 RepID=A0A409VV95_9AGAR|nr:hypothetical protein CVT26_014460 [Gymnopilus dilepis]